MNLVKVIIPIIAVFSLSILTGCENSSTNNNAKVDTINGLEFKIPQEIKENTEKLYNEANEDHTNESKINMSISGKKGFGITSTDYMSIDSENYILSVSIQQKEGIGKYIELNKDNKNIDPYVFASKTPGIIPGKTTIENNIVNIETEITNFMGIETDLKGITSLYILPDDFVISILYASKDGANTQDIIDTISVDSTQFDKNSISIVPITCDDIYTLKISGTFVNLDQLNPLNLNIHYNNGDVKNNAEMKKVNSNTYVYSELLDNKNVSEVTMDIPEGYNCEFSNIFLGINSIEIRKNI